MTHPEQQYLDLMAAILERGDERLDRTGVGTRSMFGATLRFDLSDGTAPILTTKRVYWKTAVKEMLWFLTGGTNIRALLENNVRIWTDWPWRPIARPRARPFPRPTSRPVSLPTPTSPRAGANSAPSMASSGAAGMGPDGQEIDQVAQVIEMLRTNPTSRRILFHAWKRPRNPRHGLAAVPHGLPVPCQQGPPQLRPLPALLRSPARRAVQLRGRQRAPPHAGPAGRPYPGELVWFAGDVHLYLNHLEAAQTQLARTRARCRASS